MNKNSSPKADFSFHPLQDVSPQDIEVGIDYSHDSSNSRVGLELRDGQTSASSTTEENAGTPGFMDQAYQALLTGTVPASRSPRSSRRSIDRNSIEEGRSASTRNISGN